jgi:hypothetical protein
MHRLLAVIATAFVLGISACAAELTVDGYPATYVERPRIERARRWRHGAVEVYEVDGRYYREHGGRWVVYRERPRELIEVTIR